MSDDISARNALCSRIIKEILLELIPIIKKQLAEKIFGNDHIDVPMTINILTSVSVSIVGNLIGSFPTEVLDKLSTLIVYTILKEFNSASRLISMTDILDSPTIN